MLSLYIHIPFCQKKCNYCSFPVIPIEKLQQPQGMADQYFAALSEDITYWSSQSTAHTSDKKIHTIYFGGGTPLLMGADYIIKIMNQIEQYFDCSEVQELTIECNPYPYETTLETVRQISTTYSHLPRIRFSFGIQTLDDELLKLSNRDNDFAGLVTFTEKLLTQKPANVLYNYDFIAFGIQPGSTQEQRLVDLLHSHQIDSFSLYTLELFAGAKWYHETKDPLIAYQAPWDHDIPFTTSEDAIFDDFSHCKNLFLQAGYERYEISNYALPGKESIHNQVYRTMKPYLGLGLGAHSLLEDSGSYTRGTIDSGWKKYITLGNRENIMTKTLLTTDDISIETFFLGLRQKIGLKNLTSYQSYLVDGRKDRIQKLIEEGLVIYQDDTLSLTDRGMNVHHRICTYLLQEV